VADDNVSGRRVGQPRHARPDGRRQTVAAVVFLGIMVLEGVSRLITGSGWVQVTLGVVLLAGVPFALLVGPLNKRRSRRRAARAALREGTPNR